MKSYPSWIATLRRGALALAVAATAIFAACVEEDWRGERAMRQFARECAERGMPLDYAFYKPPPLPDAQNLFRDPVLARFFDPADTGKRWSDFSRSRQLPYEAWREFGQWQRGRATDFIAAWRLLSKPAPKEPAPTAREAAAFVLARLDGIKADLDALRDAARRRPRSQIEYLADGSFVVNSFGALRELSTALSWRASAEIELGRYDDAYGDIYASLRMIEGAVTFPSQLHLVFAYLMAVRSVQPFWEGFEKGVWSEAQLAEVQGLLEGFHPLRELPAARGAYRAAVVGMAARERPRWMPEGWWKLNLVREFRLIDAETDRGAFDARLETVDLRRMDETRAALGRIAGGISPFDYRLRHNPWPEAFTVSAASGQGCFALVATACALERHRLAHGEYPKALGELVPALLPSVPHDVIDGRPLRYGRTAGGGFKLYSVGLNGTDEGGTLPGPGPDKRRQSLYPWSSREGDWVWPRAGADGTQPGA